MTTVHNSIGGSNHGDVVMAGRDATVVRGVDALQALVAVRKAARALEAVGLTPAQRDAALRDLGAIEGELSRPQPDERTAAGHLERLTKLLGDAGALAAAGAALAGPLGAVAGALGPVGAAILRTLK